MKTNVREMSPSAMARIGRGPVSGHRRRRHFCPHGHSRRSSLCPVMPRPRPPTSPPIETLFRVGLVGGELIILLSEIVLTVLLYELLKPVNKTLSLLAAVSRLAMTIIHGLNLLNYYFVLQLVDGGSLRPPLARNR